MSRLRASSRVTSGVLGLLVCVASLEAKAQGIGNPDPATSISLRSDAETRWLPFAAQVISLDALNAALAAGGFSAVGEQTRPASRTTYGFLSDPAALGVTTSVTTGPGSSFSGTHFIVVADPRFVPGIPDMIEATEYMFVVGQLSGTADWVGNGYATAVFSNPNLASGPGQFPSACCPAEAATDGLLHGHRCVLAQTGLNTSSTPEGVSLPMNGKPHELYFLADSSTYPNEGRELFFADVHTPPPGLSAERCLACTRAGCTSDAGSWDAGLPDGGAPDAGSAQDAGPPDSGQRLCRADADCGPSRMCTAFGSCVGRPSDAGGVVAGCALDQDCSASQQCTFGACAPRADAPLCLGAWCEGAGRGACVTGADCAAGSRCDRGVCVPAACMAPVDCPPKYTCGLDRACHARAPAPPAPDAGAQLQSPGGERGGYSVGGDRAVLDAESIVTLLGRGFCPRDDEVTTLHCIDRTFMDSLCGARYEPAGGRAGLCDQLIAQTFASEPKRNPAMRSPVFREVCEEVERAPAGGAVVQPRGDPRHPERGGVARPAPSAAAGNRDEEEQDLVAQVGREAVTSPTPAVDLDPDRQIEVVPSNDARVCRDELVPWRDEAENAYNRDFLEHGGLFHLDGHALSTRQPVPASLTLSGDEDFDRSELTSSGVTGTRASRSVRGWVEGPRGDLRAKRAAIEDRERRWRGNGQRREIRSCDEYAFQRFYDFAKFEEEAAMLGKDDWAIWEMAFGPADRRTSIGTRMIEGTGLKDFASRPIRRNDGREVHPRFESQAVPHYKNVFFALAVEDTFTPPCGAFFYKPLLDVARAETFNEGWRWHEHKGRILRSHPLEEFDTFELGDEKDFIEARGAYVLSLADAIQHGRTRDQVMADEPCRRELFWALLGLYPIHGDADPPDSMKERRALRYDDPEYRERRNGWECAYRETVAVRRARQRLYDLLARAELKGYLDLSRSTVADWSPRLFTRNVKGMLAQEREEALSQCLLYTDDDFAAVRQHFAGVAGKRDNDYTRDFAALEQYFRDVDEEIESLPKAVKGEGGVVSHWTGGDSFDHGSNGFGVDLGYSLHVDLDDFVSEGDDLYEALPDIDMGFAANTHLAVRAFGEEMPILTADMSLYSRRDGQLPTMQIVDFDLMRMDFEMDTLPGSGGPIRLDRTGSIPDVPRFVLEESKELASYKFHLDMQPFGIPLYLEGGVVGTAGLYSTAEYARDGRAHWPRLLRGELTPTAKVSAYLEGGADVLIASASVRATLVLVDLKVPVTGRMSLGVSDTDARDLLLTFDMRGSAALEMLSGNVRLKVCGGIWPFESCFRKKIFQWEAAMSQTYPLVEGLVLDEPISLITYARGLKRQR